MDSYKETIKTWNTIAKTYEEKFMDLNIYNESYDRFLYHLNLENARILDIACGPANISKYLLSKNPSLILEGLDVSENMIRLAQKNIPVADFWQMDAREIHHINKTYNGIIAGFCIPYLLPDDTEKFIESCSTLLSSEGCLYLSYVEGDVNKSEIQTGSTGDKTFFTYYATQELIQMCSNHRLECLERMYVEYKKSDGKEESHTILVFRKSK